VDEIINVVGRKTIEAVLWLSAQQVAGVPQQGRKREGDTFWHGTQRGSVYLKERKLAVKKPRLRKKEAEVAIPAYQAMQDRAGLGARMLDIVLNGVSTRGYGEVIPAMAETVGISKSSVSRETIAASEAELERLLHRRLEELDLLIIYIDGIWFGKQCVIAARGGGQPRQEARLRAAGGSHGEWRSGQELAGGLGGAGSGSRTTTSVRDRRIQGLAHGH
jgi:transposase-like protein